MSVTISSPNAAWLDYGLAVIRSIPGARISGSGNVIAVTYSGGPSALRDQLIARGLSATASGTSISVTSAPATLTPSPAPQSSPSP
jgi:hypothetical protein